MTLDVTTIELILAAFGLTDADVGKWTLEDVAVAIATGWLPIEMAPQDGSEFLLTDGAKVTTGFWYPPPTPHKYDPPGKIYKGEWAVGGIHPETGGSLESMEPTHWMHLPGIP